MGLIHGPVWTLIVLEADCLCHQPGVPIIPRPRQDFTGVANCPRPARQVLYETILISYFTQFICRMIKSIPCLGGIGLGLVLIIPIPSQDFTGVTNCPRPASQVLYETILISYFTQFIYRVIKIYQINLLNCRMFFGVKSILAQGKYG